MEKQASLLEITEETLDQIVRPEQNIERWSNFIFPHARAKGLKEMRRKEWEVELPGGEKGTASISIMPLVGQRAYTYRTYDVYLALTHIWYDIGSPDEPFTVSLRDIARAMEVPLNGKWASYISAELTCLFSTVLTWKLSFRTAHSDAETVKNQHILDVYDYDALDERATKDNRFQRTCTVRFDKKILDNLRSKKTIPVNWSVRKSIKSQHAKVLYGRIDNLLCSPGSSPSFERTSLNLLEDLQVEGVAEYQYKSRRKRLIAGIQEELDGVQLSNGQKMEVKLLSTADGNDWKLRFSRKAKQLSSSGVNKNLPIINKNNDHVDYLIESIATVVGGLEENYGLYKTFAQRYSETLIFRALGEFKEEVGPGTKSKRRFFTMKMHTVAHKMGYEWIRPCNASCKYRPENNLAFDFKNG